MCHLLTDLTRSYREIFPGAMACSDINVPKGYYVREHDYINIINCSDRFWKPFHPKTKKTRIVMIRIQTMLYSLINCVNFVHSLE